MDGNSHFINYLFFNHLQNSIIMKEKSKQLVERINLEGTPFTAVKLENDFFLTIGKYRISTKSFQKVEELTEWIELNKWEVMATFASIVAEETTKEILKKHELL